MRRVVISIETLPDFDQYVATWYANVASHYLLGIDIYGLSQRAKRHRDRVLGELYSEAQRYINELASEQKVDVCTMRSPIPLTPNDDEELFNLCKAVDLLGDASRGATSQVPLPPALSFEFAEYVRTYMPRVKTSTLKRSVVAISSEVLALAVLGAHMSRVYVAENEYGYVFISTYNPKLVDTKKLNGMAKGVVKAVVSGDGSRISLLVGVASAIVLNVGKHLYENEGRSVYSSVRIVRTGNKTMLKAFEAVDLTDLAQTIMKLGIASATYNLVSRYPSRDETRRDKRARTLRSIIEELSKAVFKYHHYGDLAEIYRVLRTATARATSSELESYLKDAWTESLNKLLEIRV